MNTKKIVWLVGIIAIIAIGLLIFQKYKPIREVHTIADYVLFDNTDKLESEADLIIIGNTEKGFSELKPPPRGMFVEPGREYVEPLTFTDIKVQKVLKGNFSYSTVAVLQPAIISNAALAGATWRYKALQIIGEYYSVMEKGKKYILFLKETNVKGIYSIVSLEQGKFNIDGLDLKEKAMSERNPQYKKLKEDVLRKFPNLK